MQFICPNEEKMKVILRISMFQYAGLDPLQKAKGFSHDFKDTTPASEFLNMAGFLVIQDI